MYEPSGAVVEICCVENLTHKTLLTLQKQLFIDTQ